METNFKMWQNYKCRNSGSMNNNSTT